MNVIEVINGKYPTMTKKQQMLVDYMLAHSDAMSFVTLKSLSEKTNVSEMTILHVCTLLGYKNYNELKHEFRKLIVKHNKISIQKNNRYAVAGVPAHEIRDKENVMAEICEKEFEQMKLLSSSISNKDLFRAAGMFLKASNTIFCGRGVSVQVAEFLSMRLATMGLPSIIVDTEHSDSIHSALPLMERGVLVVPISLPDYYFMTEKVCEFAKTRGSSILCLTDSMKSPITRYGDFVLLAPCATRFYLNTIAPMMALSNLLTSALNIEKSSRKKDRFNSAEEFSGFFK